MTLAPYGKMQKKNATVNWTCHTNSSSFSSLSIVFLFLLAGSLNSQKEDVELMTELRNICIFLVTKMSVSFFFNNFNFLH